MKARLCECGCGYHTAGGRFLPGHNVVARYAKADRASEFWTRVTQLGANDCWIWTGCRMTFGYGAMRWHGRTTPAFCTHVTIRRVVTQIT